MRHTLAMSVLVFRFGKQISIFQLSLFLTAFGKKSTTTKIIFGPLQAEYIFPGEGEPYYPIKQYFHACLESIQYSNTRKKLTNIYKTSSII